MSDRAASDWRGARREAEPPAPCAPPDDLGRDELFRVPRSIAADGSPVTSGSRTGPDRPFGGQGPAGNRPEDRLDWPEDRPVTGQTPAVIISVHRWSTTGSRSVASIEPSVHRRSGVVAVVAIARLRAVCRVLLCRLPDDDTGRKNVVGTVVEVEVEIRTIRIPLDNQGQQR